MLRSPLRAAAARSAVAWLSLLASPAGEAALCDGISPVPDTALTSVLAANGLSRPVFVTAPPGDTSRVFVVEQDGRIRIVRNGALLAAPFVDLAALTRSPADGGNWEQGLLGLAFDPDYDSNGRFFVYHTDVLGTSNTVARYERTASDPDLADPSSRQVVLTIPHPTYSNHNGGMIAFGPYDGHLYIGTGDGGGTCDPSGNAQSLGSLLGKLLRIDVRSLPYAVPPDNPFANRAGALPEIWALGLRNPWRWSFDRTSADLYIGDVGQNKWEEIDYAPGTSPGGENYGWDAYEGSECPNPSCGSAYCSLPGYVPPIHQYDQVGSPCAVTGGFVYRGCRMPGLAGTYFFGDYCAATIGSFRTALGSVTDLRDRTAELAPGGGLAISFLDSFGEDARGEIFIVDRNGGEIFQIVPVLSSLEVSGQGAVPFALGPASWSWEDLKLTSSHPVVSYRVYRQPDRTGEFVCVHQGASTSWTGGDPQTPALGGLFSYLVTAVRADGQESSPGTGAGGAARALSAAICPP
jgi:hypothetical protein